MSEEPQVETNGFMQDVPLPETQPSPNVDTASAAPETVVAPSNADAVDTGSGKPTTEPSAQPTLQPSETPDPNGAAAAAPPVPKEDKSGASAPVRTLTDSHHHQANRLIQALEHVLKVAEEGGAELEYVIGEGFENGKDWVRNSIAEVKSKL